jgi:hypothetical protein
VISYADGREARIGDRVDYDGEPAIVEDVIDSDSKRSDWGLDDFGLMLKTERYGLMFEPVRSIAWDALVLLGRAAL